MGFYHSAVVKRLQSTITDGRQSTATITVHASLPCRIGPLEARTQQAIFGDYSSERLFMEWGSEALQEGDLVEFNSQVFVFSAIKRDLYRPGFSVVASYQTGALTLQAKSRRVPS